MTALNPYLRSDLLPITQDLKKRVRRIERMKSQLTWGKSADLGGFFRYARSFHSAPSDRTLKNQLVKFLARNPRSTEGANFDEVA